MQLKSERANGHTALAAAASKGGADMGGGRARTAVQKVHDLCYVARGQ